MTAVLAYLVVQRVDRAQSEAIRMGVAPHHDRTSSPSRLPAMPVDIDIDHVARLARIALTDDEKATLKQQLGVILEHAAKVGEVAAEDVPPTAYAVPRANVLRDDVLEPCLPVDEALRNVPDREGDYVRVPRIIEGGP